MSLSIVTIIDLSNFHNFLIIQTLQFLISSLVIIVILPSFLIYHFQLHQCYNYRLIFYLKLNEYVFIQFKC
jgi:hypothetical protein